MEYRLIDPKDPTREWVIEITEDGQVVSLEDRTDQSKVVGVLVGGR